MSLFKYSSPATFYPLAGKMLPFFAWAAVIFGVVGMYVSFFVAPLEDYQQGPSYKIMFIHVPAAWMSMFIYVVMCMWAAAGMIWNTRLSSMMAKSLAPTGAMFTFVALWTGAVWGKPTWGTWWVWDARLTSELILFFLYVGFIALESAIDDPRRAARASGLLALVGIVNIPIIYFSVVWWSTLHQPPSITTQKTSMGDDMLAAILLMTLCFWMYTITVALSRVRSEILAREKNTDWVKALLSEGGK